MSRLHLIVLFIGLGFLSFSQNNLGKYLDFAKEQFNRGDYYYALEYYEKAQREFPDSGLALAGINMLKSIGKE